MPFSVIVKQIVSAPTSGCSLFLSALANVLIRVCDFVERDFVARRASQPNARRWSVRNKIRCPDRQPLGYLAYFKSLLEVIHLHQRTGCKVVLWPSQPIGNFWCS